MSDQHKIFWYGACVTCAIIFAPITVPGTRYIHQIYGPAWAAVILIFIVGLSLFLRTENDNRSLSILAKIAAWTLILTGFVTSFGALFLIGPLTRAELGSLFMMFIGIPAMIIGFEKR